MRLAIEARLDYAFPRPADVLLQIEAAAMPDQRHQIQSLLIGSDHPNRPVPCQEAIGRRTLSRACP